MSYSLHLSPLPPLLHWSSKLDLQIPPLHAALGGTGLQPPLCSVLHRRAKTRRCFPRGCIGDGACGAPRVLQEKEGSARSRRGSPGLPLSRRCPSAQPGLGHGRGSPRVPTGPLSERRGRRRGGRERQRPLPLPAPRTFCFSSQGQRTMRSPETPALTRRRAARWQAPGAPRTGRCSRLSLPAVKGGPAPARRGSGSGSAPQPGAIAARPSAAPLGSPARRPPEPRSPQSTGPELAPGSGTQGARRVPPALAAGRAPGDGRELRLLPGHLVPCV